MQEEKKFAEVEWERFGKFTKVLGTEFFDDKDRLAIVTCPYCGYRASFEYFEYMNLLRNPTPTCGSCRGAFLLLGGASARKERKKPDDPPTPPRPGEGRSWEA